MYYTYMISVHEYVSTNRKIFNMIDASVGCIIIYLYAVYVIDKYCITRCVLNYNTCNCISTAVSNIIEMII